MNILDLPDDCLSHIASFLSIRAIGKFTTVSKKARSLCDSDLFWHQIWIRDVSEQPPSHDVKYEYEKITAWRVVMSDAYIFFFHDQVLDVFSSIARYEDSISFRFVAGGTYFVFNGTKTICKRLGQSFEEQPDLLSVTPFAEIDALRLHASRDLSEGLRFTSHFSFTACEGVFSETEVYIKVDDVVVWTLSDLSDSCWVIYHKDQAAQVLSGTLDVQCL